MRTYQLLDRNSFRWFISFSSFICFLVFAPSDRGLIFFTSASVATVPEQVDLLLNIETFDKWVNVANIDLPFETYHPQGIVKIGDRFFLTAIDGDLAAYIIEFDVKSPGASPARNPTDISSKRATFIRQVQLADPSFPKRIHPGGIDYDASRNRIWCPLAEKLADTSTSILTINPKDLSYDNIGYVLDHLGTTIVDAENNRVRMIDYHTGMYSFPVKPNRTFLSDAHTTDKFLLPHEPIEYQDCKHLAQKYALCAGKGPHRVDLIHFDSDVDEKTDTRYSIERRLPLGTSNLGREAMTFEILDDAFGRRHVRFYFKPDDGNNTKLRIYDAYRPS